MGVIIFSTFIGLFGYLLVKFLGHQRKLHRIKIPIPNTFPFIIEIFYPVLKLGIASAEERFSIIASYCFKFPDMMKLWLGPKMVIFVNNPDRIQKVLMSQKCLEKWNFFYNLMERDHGLISASVKGKWKEHRKFFNFSFNLKILESFMPTFVDYSEVLCENLAKEIGSENEFDFLVYAKKASFDILCATSLGTNVKDLKNEKIYEKIFDAFEMTELAMGQKFSIPFLYPQTFFKLTKLHREERKAQKLLDEFQHGLMKKRRAALKKRELCNNNNEEEILERNILIDHIILNEEKFTCDEIRDHILTFVSGYETWGIALAHAMLLLAMHPEVQEKLVGEIEKKIKSDNDLKNSEIVNGIEYLDLVQKEIGRLLPVVPMVLRETLEDFEMEPGLVIPKNINLVINFYALHRQPDIWGKDAEEFKPERFLPENSINRNPFAFLPFSSGQRICIAFKYSNISMKIAIIKLLQRFRFKTSIKMQDVRLKSYISLKLCTEHLMKIERR